jgi:Dyp-type peroxidase family
LSSLERYPTVAIDLADVQTHVIRGIDAHFVVYFFFRISDAKQFRSALPVQSADGRIDVVPVFRSEKSMYAKFGNEEIARSKGSGAFANIAFTHSGLEALGIDRKTLDSFPEPFRQGMAHRAARLGDEGDAAPERWQGYLGSREIHGVLSINFRLDDARRDEIPAYFDTLVKTFTVAKLAEPYPPVAKPGKPAAACSSSSDPLAAAMKVVFAFVKGMTAGAEVLHVETGMSNYRQGQKGPYRVEHFGFRDGVSQPYLDLGLRSPPPGGGTPRIDGTWEAVRPGELLLGQPDEDGLVQRLPANATLRDNGTYMVFRKLAQDVVRFREFAKAVGAKRSRGAAVVAAAIVGRWHDGSPLVRFPFGPGAPEAELNDFRYQAEDPWGQRCPIGAHVRRSNPRDTNFRDEARRHRLFRRGTSYGGALLPEDSADDGVERGLLFISLQARLDHQFEFVQANWLNRGEFSGQTGARRDPLVFPHAGRTCDEFLMPGEPAPITGLPRFVKMRGGDYFFVPSFTALRAMRDGSNFAPTDLGALPQAAIGAIEPDKANKSDQYVAAATRLLATENSFLELPSIALEPYPGARPVEQKNILVAHHKHVVEVFKDDRHFSTNPYQQRSAPILGGERLLLAMQSNDDERKKRLAILLAAQAHLASFDVAKLTATFMDSILRRLGPTGGLDVVGDVGRVIPILCAARLFGVTGPDWISPAGIAARFGRSDVTEAADDWLAGLPKVDQFNKPLLTMQTWTRFVFLQIFVNIVAATEPGQVAERATRELMRRIDFLINEARRVGLPETAQNLLQALLKVSPGDIEQLQALLEVPPGKMQQAEFDRHVRLILAELMGGAVETVNTALVNIVDFLLNHSDQLERAAGDDDAALDKRIREILRLDPVNVLGFRTAQNNATLGGRPIQDGTLVTLVPKAAMMDPRAFPEPRKIDLDRKDPQYLHFGGTIHPCLGRVIAEPQLRVMVRTLARLPRLRRAAGIAGTKQQRTVPPLVDSMMVRFTPT